METPHTGYEEEIQLSSNRRRLSKAPLLSRWAGTPNVAVRVGLLLLLCLAAAAQPSTRTVSGTVVDRNGKPVAGAVVQLENSALLRVRSYITQSDGMYHFVELYRGADYRLKAIYHGAEGPGKTLSKFDSHDSKVINLEVPIFKRPPATG